MVAGMAVILVCVVPAIADVFLGTPHNWDPYPGPGQWVSQYGWTTVDTPSTGGHTGGWLRVTFPTTASPPHDEWYDIVRTDPSLIYSGEWTTNMWIDFDFWESNMVANSVQVRWKSTTNDFIWRYTDLTPPPVGTWTTMRAPFLNWRDWRYPGATVDDYLSDIKSIEWIGVYVYRKTDVLQVYGIDNFRLMIPEPAELVVLAVAMITSGMSLRRKKRRQAGPP